jgi:hypothetical protein
MKCLKCNETSPLFKIGEFNGEDMYLCRYHVKMEQTNLYNTVVDWEWNNKASNEILSEG